MQNRLDDVYRFWFGDYESDAVVLKEKGPIWFTKNPEVDHEIKDKFEDLVEMASVGDLPSAGHGPRVQLVSILLLDQFTRNIYRGDPRSFASDERARHIALDLLTSGTEGLRPLEKVFLYLPFEHSEDIEDQKRSVALYQLLCESVAAELQENFTGFYDYAVRHHDIIAQFGRFPHRNEILGRTSTIEEQQFLSQPGSSF